MPEFDTSGIMEFMSRDADQPFFLATAFHEAHAPWTVACPDKFDLAKMTLLDNLADRPWEPGPSGPAPLLSASESAMAEHAKS